MTGPATGRAPPAHPPGIQILQKTVPVAEITTERVTGKKFLKMAHPSVSGWDGVDREAIKEDHPGSVQ
jgi:hypothetical protein